MIYYTQFIYSIIHSASAVFIGYIPLHSNPLHNVCVYTQTSHIIACFLGSFCYIQTVFLLNWLTAQPPYEVKTVVDGDK
jgi:hypothetical protein